MKRIYIPASELADWRKLLADPDKHWREKYSAMEVANSWHHADGFPQPIGRLLSAGGEPLHSLEPLIIIPEHQVELGGHGRNSQNDVWILAKHRDGFASITVEAKVSESFGETLGDWLKDASSGKHQRLDFLKGALGLSGDLPNAVRYQLLHRTASALIEAKRFRADTALMLVQSFSPEDVGLQDYQAFAALFGTKAGADEVVQATTVDGIALYLGWVRDRALQDVPERVA